MPELKYDGIKDVIKEMVELGERTGEGARRMLRVAAQQMKYEWVTMIDRYKFVKSGEMREKVGYPRKPKEVEDVLSIDVYPQGKDSKTEVRNATKAFFLHYGNSNMDATHFVDHIVSGSSDEIEQLMIQAWRAFVMEKMKG